MLAAVYVVLFFVGKINSPYVRMNTELKRLFLESELMHLGQMFFLDVMACAAMSDHFHVVLFTDQQAQW